ncbi:acyl-CoA thioesterase [Lutibacter holmesii]|uniref:Acyl-CoA thioesterase n=1 Tax=Lutibacter holmesii TaxID=1137985 RepID=A0ABW3WNW1_9FLAO
MKNNYTFHKIVSENAIDNLNHVNNLVYLEWVLKAAEKHWNKLSSKIINQKYVWVVLRHEIDYIAAAKLGDKITIETWIGESVGVKSDRYVEIKRGNKLLAKAKTTWCLLDKKKMRAVRIPTDVLDILN